MLEATLRPYQNSAVDVGLERGNLLIAYEMGLGKEQPVSEPVLTPDRGWVRIGDIRPGDQLVSREGTPTTVLGVFPQGAKPVYRVGMSDGSFTRAGADHLWEVRTNNDLTRGTHRVLSTSDMLEAGLRDGAGNRKFRIPMVSPVVYPERDLPIDPYALGVLLGDGSIKYSGVGFTSADAWLVEELARVLPDTVEIVKGNYHERPYDYRIVGVRRWHNEVSKAIGELGLRGTGSMSKFIPNEYLLASVEQRISLLQGILDTDGHVRPDDNNVEYSTISPALIRDVQELVHSLGGTARIRIKTTLFSTAYRMSIALPEGVRPFRLPRKADVYLPRSKYKPTRLVDSIEPDGVEESVCVLVDNAAHLYVTRHHIVTHNTIVSLAISESLLGDEKVDCVMIVVPSNLKWQWAQQIAQHTDVETTSKTLTVDGKRVDITIPTDEYCVVVDGDKVKREKAYALIEATRPDYVVLSYESVVGDWTRVRKIHPGAIFLDEITAIKSFAAQRSKKIKRLHADYRYGLTGTPVENGKPDEVYSIMEWIDKDVLGRFDMFERSFIVRNGFGGIERYKNLPTLHAKLSTAMQRKRRTDDDVRPFLPEVQEDTVRVEMPTRLKVAYQALAADLLEELRALPPGSGFNVAAYYAGNDQGGDMSQAGRIMARMQAVDMLLDHPALVVHSAAEFAHAEEQQAAGVVKATWPGSKYAFEVVDSGLISADLPTPKMDRVQQDIEEILASSEKNKIIVFSFYRQALEELAQRIQDKVGVVQYHGGMNGVQKAAAVAEYTTNPDCRVILCSHAGAFGTDLHMANYLLNLDLAWSAGTQDQINARHVRVASAFKNVFIRNYIVEGTTEQRKLDLLAHKRRVAGAILDGVGADEKTGAIDNDVASLTEAVSGTV